MMFSTQQLQRAHMLGYSLKGLNELWAEIYLAHCEAGENKQDASDYATGALINFLKQSGKPRCPKPLFASLLVYYWIHSKTGEWKITKPAVREALTNHVRSCGECRDELIDYNIEMHCFLLEHNLEETADVTFVS